jgi:hypothetical protein
MKRKSDFAVLNGRLGEIIEECTAGLARGGPQYFDVAHRTIIEVLLTQPEVPLIGLLRHYVAWALEAQWIPKSELKKTYKQRQLEFIETLYSLAQLTRKTKPWAKAGKPKPKGFEKTSLDAVADALGKSPEALVQSIRRGRRPRKKPQP